MTHAIDSQLLNNDDFPGLPTPRRFGAIAALALGTALVVIDGSIPSVALPTIAKALSVDASIVVLIISLYQLVLVMTLLPFSAMGQRIGFRTLYCSGLAVFALASTLCFFAPSLPLLLAARGLQALGAGAALSVSSALVRSIYPSARLGHGLAINGVIVSAANAFAPTIGGAILSFASWPYIFIAVVPLALFSLALARFLPEPIRRVSPYDWTAAGLCATTFGLITGGLELLVHGASPPPALGLLLAGLAVGFVFVRRELYQSDPILPVDLIARRVIGLSVVGAVAGFMASMMVIVTTPFRLHLDYGFSPVQIGAMIAPWPLMVMFVAPVSGMLSDRVSPAKLGGCGMALSVIGLLCLSQLPPVPDWFDVAWRLALSGAGFGMFLAPNGRLILTSAPHDRAASAGGLISTTRLTGQLLGATVAAGLLALGPHGAALAPLIAAGLCLIAGFCSLVRLRA